MVYFVCYPVGYSCKNIVWYLCPIGCHEVVCCYSSDSYKVVIGSVVAHYAYCLDVRENCKELAQAAFNSAFLDLVTENGVCFLQHLYLILCYLTDYSYTKSWAWERLTPYKLLWYAELFADFSYLIFEEVAKRFYNAVKVDVLRHFHLIVVSFYCGSVALSAFDSVRVDSTLCEKSAVCFFSDLIPEYLIELCSDSLSLFLWICYAFELFKELLLTVYSYKSHIEKSCESFLNKVALVFSHKALIYEHAGELFTHCTADKSCGN